ncbi:hypothetical protein GGP57_003305 [Salinibacter ruber]|uniref:hypothetical protein n=1 Tax=Salinibacter ruber TaxID=146919 RepID=UPI002169E5EF|nr:hypothetical protein [Salinibacter ruber]MCS3635960.1 hypothetical protein [Salinibacter ruber]MCS3715479.1 hypothetical protein [Salinibacter ruber]
MRFSKAPVSLVSKHRLYSIKAGSYRSEQLQGPLRFMISSRSGDHALKQSLRTGSNMPFSPVYLLESVEATGSARPVQKELTGSP